MNEARLALFMMLGQTASRHMAQVPDIPPTETLSLSPAYDLAKLVPDVVRSAVKAAEAYKYFFVFETYLRELVVEVLSQEGTREWWDKLPKDVQDEITKLAENEEVKSWMALGSRDKSALMTYPQLLRIIEHCWKEDFEELIRDRALVQQARLIGHLRNTTCHMVTIPEEEMERIKQTMRDWFRRIPV
jgi:hypothetical protein